MMNQPKLTLFSKANCELGEAPLWHSHRQSLFWLDIAHQVVYEKAFDSNQSEYDHKWPLPYTGSALAVDALNVNQLWVITEHSLGLLSLLTGQYMPKVELSLAKELRTNDGSVSPEGDFWFGTMEKSPTGPYGKIYSISPNGQLRVQLEQIGIPNTFCWLNDGSTLLLSDSQQQVTYAYDVNNGQVQHKSQARYLDLSQTKATPDGGAIDQQQNFWNAQWDGFCVACYNQQRQLIKKISLPIPKPTSCCFGGPEHKHLFITSAFESMTPSERLQYPLSGSVFVMQLEQPGVEIKSFSLEGTAC